MAKDELKWEINIINGNWELKVNNEIIIELDINNGVWTVWLGDRDRQDSFKIGDYYFISEAKEKGLKVAKAIIEY